MSIFLTLPRFTPWAATAGISFFGSKDRVQNRPIESMTRDARVWRFSHGNLCSTRRPLIWHGVPTNAMRSTPSGAFSFSTVSAWLWWYTLPAAVRTCSGVVARTGVPMNASSFWVMITPSMWPRSSRVASSAVTTPPSWAPPGLSTARADTASLTGPTGSSGSCPFSFSTLIPASGQ